MDNQNDIEREGLNHIHTADPDTIPKSEVTHEAKLDKIEKAYSSTPWWYDVRGFFILTFAYRSTLPAQIRLFSRNMGPRHLESAIGTGTLFELVLKWRKLRRRPTSKITGFDYAPKMLEGALYRFRNESQVELEVGDATKLAYESETFDTVNIANAVHCFPDVQAAFEEVHRVLKTGGTFAANVLTPPKGNGLLDRIAKRINRWGIKKGILYRPYAKKEIREILEKLQFEFVYEHESGNCYEFIVKKKELCV